MSHLTLETLARLVDEPPEEAERRHLAACAMCSTELDAMVEQRAGLRSLPDLAPPPDSWPLLRARLKEEGLLRERRVIQPPRARAAAAAVLFLAGGAMGYAVRGPTGPEGLSPAPIQSMAGDPSGMRPADVSSGPEMTRDVEEAGERFMAALDRYMATAGEDVPDPAARLAALDNIVLMTAEALHEAPSDPIINTYHVSALAQRNAVLRQLAGRAGQPVF